MYKKIIFNEAEYNRSPSTQLTVEAKDLIGRLLEKNPKNRPKICAIKEHAFFKDLNFEDILNMKVKPPFIPDNVFQKLIYRQPNLNILIRF